MLRVCLPSRDALDNLANTHVDAGNVRSARRLFDSGGGNSSSSSRGSSSSGSSSRGGLLGLGLDL